MDDKTVLLTIVEAGVTQLKDWAKLPDVEYEDFVGGTRPEDRRLFKLMDDKEEICRYVLCDTGRWQINFSNPEWWFDASDLIALASIVNLLQGYTDGE